MATEALLEVPLDDPRRDWGDSTPVETEHLGRRCLALDMGVATLGDVEPEDGFVELDVAMSSERGFHGVVWRVLDPAILEPFFVRPHQVGNPDAVQSTPVFNDVSAWQLYHGPGFWAPIACSLDTWFTIRVAFSGSRAEALVGTTSEPSLVVPELKRPMGRDGAPARITPVPSTIRGKRRCLRAWTESRGAKTVHNSNSSSTRGRAPSSCRRSTADRSKARSRRRSRSGV